MVRLTAVKIQITASEGGLEWMTAWTVVSYRYIRKYRGSAVRMSLSVLNLHPVLLVCALCFLAQMLARNHRRHRPDLLSLTMPEAGHPRSWIRCHYILKTSLLCKINSYPLNMWPSTPVVLPQSSLLTSFPRWGGKFSWTIN